jgi:hypothetical protein
MGTGEEKKSEGGQDKGKKGEGDRIRERRERGRE